MSALRNVLATGLAAAALLACGRKETSADPSAPEAPPAATALKPELGEFGVETSYLKNEVKPGDDFFRHVNGGWLETFKIPDDYSSYGSFTVLFERSEARVRKIIEDAAANAEAADIEKKIGAYYRTYTDVASIEAAGLAPLAADFARIDQAASHEDVARLFAAPDLPGQSPFRAYVDVDAKAPDRYVVYVTQAGLGMPNRDYYLEEKFADKQAKYKAYVEKVLTLAGVADAAAKAAAIYDLEYKIAEIHWTPAKRRERDLTYNKKSRAELRSFAPGAPWDAMFAVSDLSGAEAVVLREFDAIQNLAELFASTPVETWKDYLKFHVVNARADVLPKAIDDANFAFFGTELRGTPVQKERWKRGVQAVNDALGEAVGRIYVERHFPAQSKAQMEALVANLRTALGERIDKLPWMGAETKARAQEKLSKFTPKIGYPEKWRDYSGLDVVDGDAWGNAARAAAFEWAYDVSRLGKPVDKTEWGMTPQTVNAYYSSTRNEIVFPAAILQAPFFDPLADPAVNYGAIGAVIGHEIGHGFDDQGRKSDGDGFLRDWWTAEDAASFAKLADKLGAQYAKFEPIPGFPIDPKLTMGENIGDLGGLAMAYHAYKLSLNGAEAPIIDGFTGDQRFFLAWAQVWKRLVREEQLKNQIATDSHSPAEFRVNGVVRNMDAWYAAFSVSPADKLYLPPEERVQIW
ncbi:MAG: M13 family metallopeptidase [Parvularculaceae bacterium]|nr:M13 family metallopeptidase [Parvularculaceae bacterium]